MVHGFISNSEISVQDYVNHSAYSDIGIAKYLEN